ncbi:MAG: 23S rRNA (pseudouridine(1915)-N(3))-methyltransferase RlmH, partial [Gammaproteobacteria bacterium]
MQINILAVGEKSPSWVMEGVSEYTSRMPHECKVKLVTVSTTKRAKNISILQAQEREQALLLKHTPRNSYRVALDEHGKSLSTSDLASKLESWIQNTPVLALYIGGPDGFTSDFLEQVDIVLSLSSLTMPHMLARLVVVEQLYRAWTVIQG